MKSDPAAGALTHSIPDTVTAGEAVSDESCYPDRRGVTAAEPRLATQSGARRVALVTGATGFIGRALVPRLVREGWQVLATVRPGSTAPVPAGVIGEIRFDLSGSSAPELPAGIDTVFHLAGKAHALAEVAQDNEEYAVLNTAATGRLFEAADAAGVRAFVYFSSVKAVGNASSDAQPIDETYDRDPGTAYGRSKRAAERLVLEATGVPHRVVLRPTLVYGPGAKGNLEKMIAAVAANRFPPLPESGNRRSMIHIDDVCAAAIAAATHAAAAGRTYILTDGVPVSTRQLFEWMCAAVGRSVPRWTVPYCVLRLLGWGGDGIARLRGRRFVFDSDALAKLTESAWYSSARIERELGWRARHSLQESLPEIVGADRRTHKSAS